MTKIAIYKNFGKQLYKVGDMDVNVHTEKKRLTISMLLQFLYWPKEDLPQESTQRALSCFDFMVKVPEKFEADLITNPSYNHTLNATDFLVH